MKPITHNSYIQSINRASHYIATHLDETIDVKTLARVANLSDFHFQSHQRRTTHRLYRQNKDRDCRPTAALLVAYGRRDCLQHWLRKSCFAF